MQVITISGSARSGKTTMGLELKRRLEEKGYKVMVAQYGDFLKMVLKNYYGWNGEKDRAGRELLQQIGTGLFRVNSPDIWVNMMIELIRGWGEEVDILIIPDTRFRNEIVKLRNCKYVDNVITVKIVRSNFDDGLTNEQRQHPSERALDSFSFDLIVENDKGLQEYLDKAEELISFFERFGRSSPFVI